MQKQSVVYTFGLKMEWNLDTSTTWMNFGDISQSETNQSPKNKHCVILLIWGP